MIVDKFTKAIMTVIAISLFMIALNPWVAPTKAYAELEARDITKITLGLAYIESAIKNIDCTGNTNKTTLPTKQEN